MFPGTLIQMSFHLVSPSGGVLVTDWTSDGLGGVMGRHVAVPRPFQEGLRAVGTPVV